MSLNFSTDLQCICVNLFCWVFNEFSEKLEKYLLKISCFFDFSSKLFLYVEFPEL